MHMYFHIICMVTGLSEYCMCDLWGVHVCVCVCVCVRVCVCYSEIMESLCSVVNPFVKIWMEVCT